MVSFKQASSLILTANHAGAAPLTQPSAQDFQQNLLNQMGGLNGVLSSFGSSRHRKVQEFECPETPFLWKITQNNSGEHVGFGLGTMHLPVGVVLTETSYASIFSAIADSCDVYGEVNLLDPNVMAELQQCVIPLAAAAAKVSDIPDEDIKAAYEAKVMEIASSVVTGEDQVDAVYQNLLLVPLFNLQQTILNYNTPEYEPYFLASLTGMPPVAALDEEVLGIGRVPGGLEEVSTQCGVLEELYTTPEDIDTSNLMAGLNQSLSSQIAAYRCGNADALDVSLSGDGEMTNELEMMLLNDRNEQMAAAIADILSTSDNKALFAIGFLHWLHGDKSLNNLLDGYGYSLELVPNYGHDDAEDLSNEQCGVEFNSTSNLFELTEPSDSAESGAAEEGVSTSSPPTASSSPTQSPATVNSTSNLFELTEPSDSAESGSAEEGVSTSSPSTASSSPTQSPATVTPLADASNQDDRENSSNLLTYTITSVLSVFSLLYFIK